MNVPQTAFATAALRSAPQGLLAVALLAGSCLLARPGLAQDEPGEDPLVDYRTDPLVEAVVETNPTTPHQLLRAVNVLVDLNRGEAAKPYLQRLLDAGMDDDELAQLAQSIGEGRLLKLSTHPGLQPEGDAFASAALAAAARRSSNEDQLAEWILQAQYPDTAARRRALLQLRRAGSPAIAAMLRVLSDDERTDEHEAIRRALVAMGAAGLPQLIAVLDAPQASLVAQVVEVLGRIQTLEPTIATSLACPTPYLLALAVVPAGDEQVTLAAQRAAVDLLGRLPTASEVAELLERQARHFLAMSTAGTDQLPSTEVEWWTWDDQQGMPLGALVPTQRAAIEAAAQLARAAYELSPENRLRRRIFLSAACEAEIARYGWEHALPQGPRSASAALVDEGPDAVLDLLDYALKNRHVGASTVACRVAGDIASPAIVYAGQGRPVPLVGALRHSNRFLRFAAVEALMKLAPPQPYPGSSYATDALGYLIGTTGMPRAFVVHARSDEGNRLATLLLEMGYEAEAVVDGRSFFSQIASSPDCDLILMSIALPGRAAFELLTELRRDPRTAEVPVGLIAGNETWSQAEHLARKFPRTAAIMRPLDVDAMAFQIERRFDATSTISSDERTRQALAALIWLAEIARQPRSFYDLRAMQPQLSVALNHPDLSLAAAEVLAQFGTPRSQLDLVTLVNRYRLPLEVRQAAAEAFCRSVDRFGIQLTTRQILEQYDHYEKSGHLDEETQELLGSILDCLEAPAATRGPLAAPVATGT